MVKSFDIMLGMADKKDKTGVTNKVFKALLTFPTSKFLEKKKFHRPVKTVSILWMVFCYYSMLVLTVNGIVSLLSLGLLDCLV